jgi:hypothetical protein
LPSFDKITESYIAEKLMDYLTEYQLTDANQYGFHHDKSTNLLLERYVNLNNNKLNEQMHVIALFIVFSKAFDVINHSKLIKILKSIGIRGNILKWFRSYLHERKLMAKINNIFSDEEDVNSGVPQGSILGPILYLIYVTGVNKCFKHCHYFIYADDICIIAIHKDLKTATEYMKEDL